MATHYSTNNSGGSWWLSDDDWKALEAAGWIVNWVAKDPNRYGGERWLGALATSAIRPGLSEEDAIAEWEQITGQNADDEGCECCGEPHYFGQVDEADVPLLDLGEVPTRDLDALEAPGGPA